MSTIAEQFIFDINTELSKLIPKTWKVMFPKNPNEYIINIFINPFSITDYNTTFVYRFPPNDIKQLFQHSQYNSNISQENKQILLKQSAQAAYNKLQRWLEQEANPSQNNFALFVTQKLKNELDNDWDIIPMSDDKKTYNKISFKRNNCEYIVPIDVHYIKFHRGSIKFNKTSELIKRTGTKKVTQLLKNEDRIDIFECVQDKIIDKKALKDAEKVDKNILLMLGDSNNFEASAMETMSQKEIESMIFN